MSSEELASRLTPPQVYPTHLITKTNENPKHHHERYTKGGAGWGTVGHMCVRDGDKAGRGCPKQTEAGREGDGGRRQEV